MANMIKEHRRFGLLVGGIFSVIGLWPLIRHGENIRLWALIPGSLLVGMGLLLPGYLGPIYKGWMAIGHVLGWINTRIILGVLYYALFTPIGLVMRVWRKDVMRRQYDETTNTYRVLRQPRPAAHMLRQF